jgi:response regulator RpfG family c-di-GMP phosphodiesterase
MAYKHRILFVDDEVSILKSLKRLFRKEKYEIFLAEGGRKALELIAEVGKPFSLIMSDQRMPGMNGAEFLTKAKGLFPRARRILLTGYSDLDAIISAVNDGEIHRYLTKPWNDDDLILAVRQEIEQYDLIIENLRLQALNKKQNKQLARLNDNLEAKVAKRSQEVLTKNKQLSVLNEKLEANLLNTVRAFGSIIEISNPTMAGHGRRVSEMAVAICRAMELSKEEIEVVEIAALLHDIGVIGQPGMHYNYAGKNTEDNQQQYETHPASGQAMVQFIDHLDQVGLLIRSHHENYDGSGFPDGLSEEEIPIGSQAIAVADLYDRIVHLKSYKEKSYQEVMMQSDISIDHLKERDILCKAAELELKKNSFIKFDPDIVKVFLKILQKKGNTVDKEQGLSLRELKKGMVLSRSLYCRSGRFLLPHQTTLSVRFLEKLQHLHHNDPVREPVYVHRIPE